MLGVNERQGQERTAVLRPLREGGQAREIRRLLDDVRHRRLARALRPHAQGGSEERAERPELFSRRRQERRRFDELPRLSSKREIEALRRAEEVRYDGEVGALRPLEEKRGTALLDHPP